MYGLQKENENNRTTIAYFFKNQSMTPPIVPGMLKLNEAFETFNCCPYVTEPCVGERRFMTVVRESVKMSYCCDFIVRKNPFPHTPVKTVLTTCENYRNKDLPLERVIRYVSPRKQSQFHNSVCR